MPASFVSGCVPKKPFALRDRFSRGETAAQYPQHQELREPANEEPTVTTHDHPGQVPDRTKQLPADGPTERDSGKDPQENQQVKHREYPGRCRLP